ncbi:FKBP-type peptidyl-prolyl cis-trans isomerase [Hymenobacter sp. BT559]|uniref:FKBP-type peptidyl-prolyl cis-trans isomerase n=1 Tax=Hymenobacter sp. BT559 TaxID=2795729 RepID=UPI0018EE3C00|nr:FKBP-type peptidyl-prolyl cis-trans isomerase [Hymenobacter sp. BT559]MBJ6143818.1 FKBP-type peptidyl-prolyl cis-trans isomerase [Hymenobacter sp. BT559]
MRLIFLLLSTLLLAQGASAQTTPAPGFATLPGSTTQYQLFRRDAAGHYAPRVLAPAGDAPYASRAGQVLLVYIEYRTDRDSVLMASRRLRPEPVPVGLAPTTKPGSIEEAMGLLLPGDSAVFRFNADTAFAQMRQAVPPFIKRSGNALRLTVAAKELVTMEQMQARQQAMMAEMQRTAKSRAAKQLVTDNTKIQAYFKEKNLTSQAKKTPGGTWYVITKRGTGVVPKPGQTVSVKYRGIVLETGKEFDSTAKHGDTPFDFTLGQGQVIAGWDQGLAVLPKGSKATLYIPSALGYGERGAGGDIPANANLSFDVELIDVKGTPTPQATAPAKAAAKAPVKKAAAGAKKAPAKKAPVKKK